MMKKIVSLLLALALALSLTAAAAEGDRQKLVYKSMDLSIITPQNIRSELNYRLALTVGVLYEIYGAVEDGKLEQKYVDAGFAGVLNDSIYVGASTDGLLGLAFGTGSSIMFVVSEDHECLLSIIEGNYSNSNIEAAMKENFDYVHRVYNDDLMAALQSLQE